MFYILYQYTSYPIHKSSVKIAENKNPETLKSMTSNLGHKFFINHSTGGIRFRKELDSSWTKMNEQA